MADFMTVVIRLPDAKNDRKQIAKALKLGATFHGGQITALSLDDEMTVLDVLENTCDPDLIGEARTKAKELQTQQQAMES